MIIIVEESLLYFTYLARYSERTGVKDVYKIKPLLTWNISAVFICIYIYIYILSRVINGDRKMAQGDVIKKRAAVEPWENASVLT